MGILVAAWLSASEGGGQNSVERDIMQVWFMMIVFALYSRNYNIIDGIVGTKADVFVKEGYKFQSFIEVLRSVILGGGGRG